MTDMVVRIETIENGPDNHSRACGSRPPPPRSSREFLGIDVIMTDRRDDRSEQTDECAESRHSEPGDMRVEREGKVRTGEDQAATNREDDPPA